MPKKLPERNPINSYARKATAARRIGPKKQCVCGEMRPEALITNSNPPICASCKRKNRGETTMDEHHVAGKSNNATTISVTVNDHRACLSPAQYDWNKETRE